MKLAEFMQKYDISQSEMKMHTCKSKTYSDTDDKFLDKTKKPGQLEIQFQADYGYGITMPLEGEDIEW